MSVSPIQKLDSFSTHCNVYIKREDLLHTEYGGNKWRKLKLNIDHFVKEKYQTLITFGGPFSNHIAATAAICRDHQIPCVAFVRGTFEDPTNPTLLKAKQDGMHIIHVSKEDYKLKGKSQFISEQIKKFNQPYLIPEGGSNLLGIDGMEDLADEINEYPVLFDYIFIASGTGATAAGLIKHNSTGATICVINVLKYRTLNTFIESKIGATDTPWKILSQYDFGGFAKTTAQLLTFSNHFYNKYKIPLDPIYNAKMIFALNSEIEDGHIPNDSNVLCVHTGGIQGITAYNYTKKNLWLDL